MTTYENKPGKWYGACSVCGFDYYDHRADDLTCPRVKPYIAGVVDVWDYDSGTSYKEKKDQWPTE